MNSLTFRNIEQAKGIVAGSTSDRQSALSDWYQLVREIPIEKLEIGDLSRAVRQSLYPEYTVPVALSVLKTRPLAGKLYDGELRLSLRSVPESFWRENLALARRTLEVCEENIPSLDEEFRPDADALSRKIAVIIR
jgi:hypothetical protein